MLLTPLPLYKKKNLPHFLKQGEQLDNNWGNHSTGTAFTVVQGVRSEWYVHSDILFDST
jgi:hypothetical protein